MKKELPVYKMVINPDAPDGSGVNFVAAVDDPAIERAWMAFNAQVETPQPMKFKQVEGDRRIITGPIMIADLPIYRRNTRMISKENPTGEFYVVFDADTIEQIIVKCARTNSFNNFNIMHDGKQVQDGVYMIESMIIDSSRGIMTPRGFDPVPDGSCFRSYKILNDTLWYDFIKTGELTGFSVEGFFGMLSPEWQQQSAIDKDIAVINSYAKDIVTALENQ